MGKQKAKEPFVYDKAKYHYDGEFPQELPHEQGFVHTGMFLGWVIDSEVYSDRFKQELDGYIVAFRAREMTGPKVFEACDGVLMDDMLSDEGNSLRRITLSSEGATTCAITWSCWVKGCLRRTTLKIRGRTMKS